MPQIESNDLLNVMAKEIYNHKLSRSTATYQRAKARQDGDKDLAEIYHREIRDYEMRVQAVTDVALKLFSEKELRDELTKIDIEVLENM